jgi:hypothetical protein
MTTNNDINAPIPFSLANGGTGANLTASNGGIFYSTASAGAILSGTATAGQLLLSGATAAPTWSTTTYPSTNAASTLLYASSANTMAALSTANSAQLVTNSSGVPAWSSTMTNGQLIIGNTSGTPTAATLTAGSNVTITNGGGTITIAAAGASSGAWVKIDSKTASNSATLNFVSELSSTYNAYVFTFSQILPVTNEVVLQMLLGTGSTPTWISSGYQGLNAITVSGGQGPQTSTANWAISGSSASGASTQLSSTNGNLCGVIYLIGTNGSSATATITGTTTYLGGSGAPSQFLIGGTIGAATYTSVQFSMSSGNISSGVIELYGIVP